MYTKQCRADMPLRVGRAEPVTDTPEVCRPAEYMAREHPCTCLVAQHLRPPVDAGRAAWCLCRLWLRLEVLMVWCR